MSCESVLDMQCGIVRTWLQTQHSKLTFSMKKSHRFSAVSMRPSALTSLRTALLNCSLSSWNRRTACHAPVQLERQCKRLLSRGWPHRAAEVSHVAGGQQVVDVDQELFVDDLVVCQQKGDGDAAHAGLGVQRQQIFLKLCYAIC